MTSSNVCVVLVVLRATGVDPHHDRLVYLSAFPLNAVTEPKRFRAFVNPGAHLVSPALEQRLSLVPGTLAHKDTAGPVLQNFFRFCREMAGEHRLVLVSHNGHHFQWPLLSQEIRRARVSVPAHFDLWDSLHAVREFPMLGSSRPVDILETLGVPVPNDDLAALYRVLDLLSRTISAPTAARRIYELLARPNCEFIAQQQRNASNQFATRRMAVNRTHADRAQPTDVPQHYDPDFIADPISEPEPPPVPRGVVVYDRACQFLDQLQAVKSPAVLGLLELLQQRHNFGMKKYHQPLTTDDGRDDLEDARQELGDLFMYACKCRLNHRDVNELRQHLVLLQLLLSPAQDAFFAPVENEAPVPSADDAELGKSPTSELGTSELGSPESGTSPGQADGRH